MAFQRVQVEFNHPGARLVRIKEDLYEGALDVARKFFMTGEPINKAVGMEWTDELRGLWLSSFRLHFSLAAVNEADGDIMAIRTTRITKKTDFVDPEQIQTSGLKRLFVYCNYCDQKADFFNYFGVEEAFHFYGLACADKYKNQGLASKLFKAAVDMIRYLDIPGVHIKGEATSNYSKMIYDHAGFKELFDQPFETFIVDGEVVVPNTGIHKSMKVYGFKAT
ncbi:uncharacterized protein LOC128245003 isoform X2 [Mya arenaria]|uniref:uncharacterized protein LOC128245003 isoform X2 n=1 Tax=Mya arenaria TaxID=6604 RepID=UPI0022E6E138|nr:uncharacterized protein LOC128245003 isoform X2 [Mya arenaria]